MNYLKTTLILYATNLTPSAQRDHRVKSLLRLRQIYQILRIRIVQNRLGLLVLVAQVQIRSRRRYVRNCILSSYLKRQIFDRGVSADVLQTISPEEDRLQLLLWVFVQSNRAVFVVDLLQNRRSCSPVPSASSGERPCLHRGKRLHRGRPAAEVLRIRKILQSFNHLLKLSLWIQRYEPNIRNFNKFVFQILLVAVQILRITLLYNKICYL
ncbi:Hypothetical_protein [Hexamita inflata]|uniref:Hypothetical_protein n=1 Tax=Hexamita inflata TaxID=28002 RepID=A0AA86VQJ2_9EUKA|nr:Hypothetical protein HINF_LOCUS61293 [Hexamita inflata]